MTKYREILRLSSLGLSQQNIAYSCNVSKKTVNRVLKRAKEFDISWLLDENDTDAVLEEEFFPSANQVTSNKRMLDSAYIHKELLRNEVSKKLLWTEYMEDCRANGEEPLMYSQFCYHIQQNEQKRRATMHINRKPGERYKRHQTSLRKKTSTIFSGNSFRRSRAVLWGSSFLVSTEGFLLEPILESPHDRGPAS